MKIKNLYQPLVNKGAIFFSTNRRGAELIKYAANGFLATKITFINEISDICEKVGADIQEVAKGIGLDGRIGSKFLHPGPGFGGSCFPKDTRALSEIAKEAGSNSRIIDSVIQVNESRKINMVKKIKNALKPLENKSLSILGITFKPNTDDMRESPSLVIVPELVKVVKNINVYDPAGMPIAKNMKEFTGVNWKNNTYECVKNTDGIVILTEWNEFRALNLSELAKKMRKAYLDPENSDSPVYELIEHIILPEFGEVIVEIPNRALFKQENGPFNPFTSGNMRSFGILQSWNTSRRLCRGILE